MANRYYPIGDKELASVTTITGLADKSDALIPWAVNCAVDYVKVHSEPECDVTNGDIIHWIHEDALELARTEWRTVRDEAGHIGTMVHDALEEWLHGKDYLLQVLESERWYNDMPVVARCAKMAVTLTRSAIDELEELGPYTVLATEQKVVNEDEWYAGRFDALLEVDGETWLIDFKTGGAFYPEWGMQLAAYAEAWAKSCLKCERVTEPNCTETCPYTCVDRIKVLRLDKKTLKAHWKDYTDEREQYWTAFQGLRDAFYVLKAKKAVKQAWLAR